MAQVLVRAREIIASHLLVVEDAASFRSRDGDRGDRLAAVQADQIIDRLLARLQTLANERPVARDTAQHRRSSDRADFALEPLWRDVMPLADGCEVFDHGAKLRASVARPPAGAERSRQRLHSSIAPNMCPAS